MRGDMGKHLAPRVCKLMELGYTKKEAQLIVKREYNALYRRRKDGITARTFEYRPDLRDVKAWRAWNRARTYKTSKPIRNLRGRCLICQKRKAKTSIIRLILPTMAARRVPYCGEC